MPLHNKMQLGLVNKLKITVISVTNNPNNSYDNWDLV